AQIELVHQHIEQRRVGIGRHRPRLAVHIDADHLRHWRNLLDRALPQSNYSTNTVPIPYAQPSPREAWGKVAPGCEAAMWAPDGGPARLIPLLNESATRHRYESRARTNTTEPVSHPKSACRLRMSPSRVLLPPHSATDRCTRGIPHDLERSTRATRRRLPTHADS